MSTKRRFSFSFLFLLLFLALFVTSAGVARADVLPQTGDTPTPTLEPLFKTPTLAPTQSTDCPGGTPVGWGTVTPSVLWNAQCQHCMLTLTPQVTGTPYPAPTWAVGMTQTAVALIGSPTPSPTGTVVSGCDPSMTATPVATSGASITLNYFTQSGCPSTVTTANYYNGLRVDFNFPDCSAATGGSGEIVIYFNNATDAYPYVVADGTSSGTGWYDGGEVDTVTVGWTGNAPASATGTWHTSFVSGYVGYSSIIFFQANNGSTSGSYAGTVYFMPQAVLPTPSPCPTSTPVVSYCSVVDGYSNPADTGDLPNIGIGPATCVSFGPYTIGLSSLNWLPGLSGISDISLPQVQICLRAIYFGNIKVFGMSFNLDILSAVVTGVLAIRWLFRS